MNGLTDYITQWPWVSIVTTRPFSLWDNLRWVRDQRNGAMFSQVARQRHQGQVIVCPT
jgi:hypothetical protein